MILTPLTPIYIYIHIYYARITRMYVYGKPSF
jgi:hypothetical protein